MNFTPRRADDTATMGKANYPSVKKYMARDEITLKPDVTINEAIEIILSKKLTGAPVLDDERNIIGMITEKDCLRIIIDSAYNNLPYNYKKVSDYMSPVVKTVSIDSNILEVANEFLTTHFRKFPVVHNGKLVGQVSRRDILKAIRELKATTW
ncbi:CBS domain-containing protein [Chondrinema litorale]|uniref:CBS domain-containing protein n=1 Tax=Chondrinema litorale TaxID=2994555 RepID=UPI0025427D63|nr:CBS domain-containing protein [Chondrinema litorale]UZR95591.1 CBS domain-containing protein [Chondrinema litorale]